MSNGIDFVIGGKNQAQPAMTAVEKSLQRLEQKTDSVGRSTQRLAAVTGTLTTVYLAVKVALAALGGLNRINAAYDAQTESVKKLNSALQIRGAAEASKGMQDVAKSIEKMTGVSDNAALALMQQASGMGFATDRMDDAAKAAIGLGNAMGKDAASALGDLKQALEGNFDAFTAVNPQIMYMRTNQEKLTAVMAIANQGLAQQAKDMTTVAGSGRRADSAMSTLMESIGKIIAPIRVLINAGLRHLATSLDSLLAPAVEYATAAMARMEPIINAASQYLTVLMTSVKNIAGAMLEFVSNVLQSAFGTGMSDMMSMLSDGGNMMDWLTSKVVSAMNSVVAAFTVAEVVITNLDNVWEMASAYAEKSLIAIQENVMHAFTETIPAYVMWFGENFINLIKDTFNGVITIITNAGRIIGESVYQIFQFIASGGEGGIEGLMAGLGQAASISLLDGFKSSLTSLPEIAERQLTQREKDLAEKIGAVGGRLGQEFSDKMKERMIGVGSTLSSEVQNAASSIDLKMRPSVLMQGIPATEGRLLTRGPGTRLPDQMSRIIQLLEQQAKPKEKQRILVQIDPQQMKVWDKVEQNTSNTMQMEAIV